MRIGKIILCGIVVLMLGCIVPVAAYSVFANDNADNGNKPTMIVEYGTGKDVGLVKVTHIDYAKPANQGKTPAKTTTCYKLAGWKWFSPVTYTIMPNQDLISATTKAMGEWGENTGGNLFTAPVEGTSTWGERDYKNSVSFGNYKTSGVIAVTATWYSRATKQAVESDILFDTDYLWGTTGGSLVMDMQNIATHEIGHTLGLSDLYTGSCSEVTMYGYSDFGDVEKSTLELPDITGLQKLYGA
jgi:hypothetical protein